MTGPKVEYAGKDLEAMDFAVRYHEWILDLMRPYLGKDLVEVGAGTGSFSQLLLRTGPRSLTLVEPSAMFESLKVNVKANGSVNIRYFHDIFGHAADRIAAEAPPDSIIYINVLEHIEDDVSELRRACETLVPGGRLFIFVPAMPFLFSEFDKKIGHFRRYRRKELREKLVSAGFEVLMDRWFDAPGILPWALKYRLMRSTTMESGAVQLYDRVVVPIIRPLENMLNPPIGKNLLFIAQRS